MSTDTSTIDLKLAHPGNSINALSWIAVAATLLRILHEAPALIEAVAAFWTAIGGANSPPAHIENAVAAALETTRKQISIG